MSVEGRPRILVVDDEPQLLRALKPALDAAGYNVSTAENGKSALAMMASQGCDAMVLDLGLPDMDGKEVISGVRQWSDVPILVLSARDVEREKIEALDLGANDFVNKPFAVGELMARLRASLRVRTQRHKETTSVVSGDLKIDFNTRRVSVMGEEIRLTPREYELVLVLARHAGRIVTHRQLIAAVWGPEATVDSQFVRVLVAQVRSKIESEPSNPRYILTELGLGYRFAVDSEP